MQIKDTLSLENRPLDKNRDKTAPSRPKTSGAAESQSSQDKVMISDRSREAARANEALAAAPATRQEKIAEIKMRIENNEYEVSSDKVAQRMIVDFLRELA